MTQGESICFFVIAFSAEVCWFQFQGHFSCVCLMTVVCIELSPWTGRARKEPKEEYDPEKPTTDEDEVSRHRDRSMLN